MTDQSSSRWGVIKVLHELIAIKAWDVLDELMKRIDHSIHDIQLNLLMVELGGIVVPGIKVFFAGMPKDFG